MVASLFGESIRARFAASSTSFIVSGVASLLVQIVAVRTLGPELYGDYVAVIAAVALCEMAVLNRGGEIAIAALGATWSDRRLSEIEGLTRRLCLLDLRWALGGFAILAGLGFLFQKLFSWEPLWIVFAGIAIPVQVGYGADKALLIVSGEIASQAKSETRIAMISCVLAITMTLTLGVVGLVGSYAAAAFVKVVMIRRLASAMRRQLPYPDHDVTNVRHASLPGQVTTTARNIVMAICEHVDILLLNAFAGPTATGAYRIAKSLATLPARAVGPVWSSVRPELVAGWYSADRHRLRAILFRPALWLLGIGTVVLPICWFLGGPAVSRIYGMDGNTVMPAMMVLLVGSWVYYGLVGWYRFMMLLDPNKWRSLLWSTIQAVWMVGAGLVLASNGPIAMASVVMVAQLVIAGLAIHWIIKATGK